MVRATIAALSIFCTLACASAPRPAHVAIPGISYPFDESTLAREDVAACFSRVLQLGFHGTTWFERAAFLRLDSQMRFRCDVWPLSFDANAAEWRHRIPDDAVAIIHSHPRTDLDPSMHDREVATTTGLHVFVVTTFGISAADANGRIVRFRKG